MFIGSSNMAVPSRGDPWSAVDMINLSPPVDCSKPYDTSTLAGKTILITGGASGFGAAFARHWARYGSHLIIGDVNDRAGEELVAELRCSPFATKDQVITYQHCDVTSWTDQLALFRTATASSPTGCIHAVVAGAGIVERDPSAAGVFDLPAALDSNDSACPPPPPPALKVLAVNLTGVMYTTHLALFYLPLSPTSAGDRHLLLISSIAGLCPLPGQTEYTVSKHGVMGLFRVLRGTAWTTRGIRVNALTPYFVDTPLLPKPALALLAGGAKAELEDVVDAATRLMADEEIRGRALLVGPKVRVIDVPADGEIAAVEEDGGFEFVEGEREREGERKQAVWEVYGHDYERVEVFVWRYLSMLNLRRRLRGWVGLVKDLWGIYVTGPRGR
jgi:NAD(P)-dependent dehydrogenase (short-subunit alcohol dehydrogenase family)